MEISPLMMARLLLYSFMLGMLTGAFYDACRIIRVFFGVKYAQHNLWGMREWRLPFIKKKLTGDFVADKWAKKMLRGAVIFTGDFLSVMLAVVGLLVLSYAYNDGKVRFFAMAGLAVGFWLYYFTAGRLVMLVSEPVAFLIKYVFCAFFVILFLPFQKIIQNVVKNIRKLHFLYSFTLEKKQKKVYNIEEKICLLELAKNGFVSASFLQAEDNIVAKQKSKKGKNEKRKTVWKKTNISEAENKN